MKNFLLLTAMLWSAFACAEGENLLYNGDFEKKVSIAKALDKNLLQHIPFHYLQKSTEQIEFLCFLHNPNQQESLPDFCTSICLLCHTIYQNNSMPLL